MQAPVSSALAGAYLSAWVRSGFALPKSGPASKTLAAGQDIGSARVPVGTVGVAVHTGRVRTTLNLDPDVWAAVLLLRKELGLGVGEAVNWLARAGLPAANEAVTKTQSARPPKFPY
jgi:hypothetical protein